MTDTSTEIDHRSSTPTTTTGRRATPSPAIATPKFAERGVRLVEDDGRQAAYVFIGDRRHPILPGPGDVQPRPAPRCALRLLRRQADKARARRRAARQRTRPSIPEWFDRDARLAVHGRAGRRGGLDVPVAGRVHGRTHAARHRGIDRHHPGVQPLDRRRLGLRLPEPHLRRAVPDAVRRRRGDRGARLVPRARRADRRASATVRSSRPTACKSPADPMFDPFWARVAEARVVVAPHAGFEDGYATVDRRGRRGVGRTTTSRESGDTSALTLFDAVRPHAHEAPPGARLRRRPRRPSPLRATSRRARRLHRERWHLGGHLAPRAPGPARPEPRHVHDATRSTSSSSTAGWRRSSRTTSPELAVHLPVERILFGSDWPHAEGVEHPKDFLDKVRSFSPADQRRIMVDNARELTFS